MSENNETVDKGNNIVDLINKLAEYANDENSTQEAINSIVGRINKDTSDRINKEMENASKRKYDVDTSFDGQAVADGLKASLSNNDAKMLEALNGLNPSVQQSILASQATHYGDFIFTRIREVKAPNKAHPTDAGIDFYVPEAKSWNDEFKKKVIEYSKNQYDDSIKFYEDDTYGTRMIVNPGSHIAIPSGIKSIIPQGFGVMLVNKSGIATKLKLDHSACLIDSEYRDEWVMCFFNHSSVPVEIKAGMKITQGLVVPIINLEIQEVLNCVYDDMSKETNDRGGGFGSTGTN